jgi:hypothetical protein
VVIFIDDILNYSRTPQEHREHVRIILSVLQERRLFAKLIKCKKSYMSLKERLTIGLVLIIPDPSKPYEVFCDTSKKGLR